MAELPSCKHIQNCNVAIINTLIQNSPPQLWCHYHRKVYHAGVDTNNLTEAFNNAFRSRYLRIRYDKTVYSLVSLLTDIVFPEQEKEYAIAVAQQTTAYRKPRYKPPDYLLNRPQTVQAECITGINEGCQFNDCDIKINGEGTFEENQKPRSKATVKVDIPSGTCECSYFKQKHIPCKHMFAKFHIYPHHWDWNKLPLSLTSASHLVLYNDHDPVNTEGSNSQLIQSDESASEPLNPPLKCTPAHKLKLAQTQARDALVKCMPLLYCTEDFEVLRQVMNSAEQIYCTLAMSANSQQHSTKLPHFPAMNQVVLKRAKESCKQLSRPPRKGSRK